MDRLAEHGIRPQKPAASIVEILQFRATSQPHSVGYLYLKEGKTAEQRVTYAELDLAARRIAASLLNLASPGDRALLFYPCGKDFLAAFFGCLYAGIVSIPLYPARANRSLARLESIIEDSGAHLALTQTGKADQLSSHLAGQISSASIKVIGTDAQIDTSSAQFGDPVPAGSDLAYLQYTSGSTSAPKGVMVTHANLAYNCAYMIDSFGLTSKDSSVTWLPHFHDMGLIEGLLNPLYLGTQVVVMSPAQFVQRPLSWLQAISDYGAGHSGAPNFAFDHCVSKIKPQQRDALDLSAWESAYCGAEPVRKATLDRFAEYFAPCGLSKDALYPCYGLAEATLMVCGSTRMQPPTIVHADVAELEQGRAVPTQPNGGSRPVVGCGHARRDMQIVIVDPQSMQPCADGTVGEIWVSGPTLPAGYWRNETATRESFQARTSDGRGPFMRTGDLGFLLGEELFIAGRLKDLIIIRGGNYYPQDIEWAVETAHPGLRPGRGAAFSVEVDEEERLVIFNELERRYRKSDPAELEEIAQAIRQRIADEFDLETFCVWLLDVGAAPMTSSGKIQRQTCRAIFAAGDRSQMLFESRLSRNLQDQLLSQSPAFSRDELAALRPNDRQRVMVNYLTEQVGRVLGMPSAEIAPDQPLGSLGLDSLKGQELTSALQEALDVKLSSTMVFNYPTLAQISVHIAEQLLPRQTAQSPLETTAEASVEASR